VSAANPNNQPNTRSLGGRPPTDAVAKAVNLAWELERRRIETSRRREVRARQLAAQLPEILDRLDRRLELLEAAIASLAEAVDEITRGVAA
jgi:hypothetical protein